MSKKLVENVFVDGNWYGPSHGNADKVPADVAGKIDNPAAWGDDKPASKK